MSGSHAPQMKNSRNIITESRVRTLVGMGWAESFMVGLFSGAELYAKRGRIDKNLRKAILLSPATPATGVVIVTTEYQFDRLAYRCAFPVVDGFPLGYALFGL